MEELGVAVRPRLTLPDFRYRSTDARGIVENEYCPAFTASVAHADVVPDPDEAMAHRWVPWDDLMHTARRAPWALSPWAVLQIELMNGGGVELPVAAPRS